LQSPIDLLDQNVKVLYGQEDQLRRDYKPANATIISRGRDIMVRRKLFMYLLLFFLKKLCMVLHLKIYVQFIRWHGKVTLEKLALMGLITICNTPIGMYLLNIHSISKSMCLLPSLIVWELGF